MVKAGAKKSASANKVKQQQQVRSSMQKSLVTLMTLLNISCHSERTLSWPFQPIQTRRMTSQQSEKI